MPKEIPARRAKDLRELFSAAGYTEENLSKRLGSGELPSRRLRNLPRLLDRTGHPDRLNTLLRWFWLGIPQEDSGVQDFVPPAVIDLMVECGLLRREGNRLLPEAMLVPYDGFLVASDHTASIDAGNPDMVLWPNPTTKLLLNFTIRRPSRQTLDLGTGNGMLALRAAAHSKTVVATDVNPQAVRFARFNAGLNEIENIEFLAGDGFHPVAERKFDLIFSNPPFFITPASQFLFCDNPLDLDELCRRMVKEAPARLEPDGYFQLLCEWAEIEGQDWHERLAEWFHDSHCDAWVLKGSTADPSEYAQQRIAEVSNSPEHDAQLYEEYMAYYRERRVRAIHKGLIAMRLREGKNWLLMEDVSDTPRSPFGEAVEQRFLARDFLSAHPTDDRLLEAKIRLSPDARLEQIFEPTAQGWRSSSLTLKLVRGFPSTVGLQPLVAEFLTGCNGERTLADIITILSGKVDAPPERVRKECLAVIRKLIEHGFVLW